MIYVGIDDTDTLVDPGTNKLAQHLVRELAGLLRGQMILRHQLLTDPRVPCTNKNGCASILFSPAADNDLQGEFSCDALAGALRPLIQNWCPAGSDPGLCVTRTVPFPIVEWGTRCQREFVRQAQARELAEEHGIYLEGLGGTEDGVIGALAAVGLMATQNDGRIIYYESSGDDWSDISGCLDASQLLARGIDEIRATDSAELITTGIIDVGKRLRPNLRAGRVVLYATRGDQQPWEAVRVV
jgi:hypothetical protein